jgi:NADPH:quinone reductase-like Zn-dependent oxidoreductase
MKASIIHEFGDEDVLKYEEAPTPEPGPGELVVKVLAAGINRLDLYLRAGFVGYGIQLPHVLGSDAAGEVIAVGEGVTDFALGDRVIPLAGYPVDPNDSSADEVWRAPSYAVAGTRAWGTYAQYLRVPARWTLKDETGLAPELAATLPMVVTTAVRAVKTVGEVKAGDAVLVHAGGSGTGSMAIQVARALGARVATTVRSDAKAELARRLGAELVVDTRTESPVERVLEWTEGAGADVVVDNLGGPALAEGLDALRPEGVLVALGFVRGVDTSFDVRKFFFSQKQIRGSLMGAKSDLAWGLEQVRADRIQPVLHAAYPLAEAAEAHRVVGRGDAVGNAVLLPWS